MQNPMTIDRESQKEIEAVINTAVETQGKLSGMTYEEGVRAALDWILGNTDETPFD